MWQEAGVILLRATRPDDQLRAFSQTLGHASGMAVTAVFDERAGPVDWPAGEKIGLTDALCADLGLHAPSDFAWRCGDYGYYAARARFPQDPVFWLIEYDVRIRRADAFFDALAADTTDFLAADLRPADSQWYWWDYQSARDAQAWRCLFPVTRLSARAIDILHRTRQRHAARLSRRLRWPNDEGFVATTIASAGLSRADFNARVDDAWEPSSFTFEAATRGESLDLEAGGPRLLHPVLFGAAYDRKLKALQAREEITLRRRLVRRTLKTLNRRLSWME